MAWPSGTKASTANVDQGADKIALARPDIKQNIDNVNDIIDTFDIASPSNGDTLIYDSVSGQWQPSINPNINIIEQDTAFDPPSPGTNPETDYSGTFTVSGNGAITTSSNTITFPAGTYVIESLGVNTSLTGSPVDQSDEMTIRLRTNDSAETLIAADSSFSTGAFSGPYTTRVLFGFNDIVTFASDTDIKMTLQITDNGAQDTFTISPIRIERLA